MNHLTNNQKYEINLTNINIVTLNKYISYTIVLFLCFVSYPFNSGIQNKLFIKELIFYIFLK